MNKIKKLLLVCAAMACVTAGAIGCGGGKAVPFEFIEEVPTEMGIAKEVYFRNYLEENDDAEYTLYVSYYDSINQVQVTEQKQSSMIFLLEQEAEYTFKIERNLNGKKSYLTCTINVLPEAPKFQESGRTATATKGSTKTFSEIFTASQYVVTPGNLESQLKFLSYDFTSKVEGVEDQADVTIDAAATDFTFTNEGVYVFDVKAENASGTATTTITVNAFNTANAAAKVDYEYDAANRVLSWEAIENATAYRVWIDNKDYVDVTETSFSFADEETYPDNEYVVKIAPVFGGTIYKGATLTEVLPVGRVRNKLALSKDMDIVSWPVRYFVETYTVIEGDQEYVLDADTLSYALKGSYATDTEVKIQVYGTFDDDTVTETAEITVIAGELGEITLDRIDAVNGVATGVEWVAFDMEEASDVWFMSEFVGQNAPNYGIQVMNLTSEWDGSYSIKTTDPVYENRLGYEYTPGGMILCNSSEQAWTNMNLYRGYKTSGTRGTVNDGTNMGLYRYKADVHYIQIAGYEIIPDSANKSARLTAYLFSVDENGTLTLVNKSSGEATWATHVLGGTYATYYGNICVTPTTNPQGPENVTFKYAKPAKTLNSLLYNVTASYEYREQLIALCEATEPSAEENFVPARVLGEVFNDGRETTGGDEGDEGGEVTPPSVTYTELSEAATLNKIVTDGNGAATSVSSIGFDGFDGETWFMVEFTGNNAPNFAVRSTKAFTAWSTDDTSADYSLGNTAAGMLITNSAYENQRGLRMFRGTNTSSAAGGNRRDISPAMNGTMGSTGPGNECFDANGRYIQIIGYAQNATTASSADITCYVFQITDDGKIELLYSQTSTATYAWNALTGSTAVIYGNIGVTAEQWGPDSVTFTYAQPKKSLSELVYGVAETYQFRSQIIELLEIAAPEQGGEGSEGGEVTQVALTEVTMDRVESLAGVATDVDFVKFEGFDGDVWFLTQFKGRNAPNYAVHAEDAFAEWGAKALAQPGADNWATAEHPSDGENYFNYFPGGLLIANSCEYTWQPVQVFRGLNTNYSKPAMGLGGDRRDGVGSGVGMYNYKDDKEYVQIIGYAFATGTVSCYVYEVNADGTLTVVDKADKVVAYSNGALKGSVAVIYPNIGVAPSVTDGVYSAQGPESITFSYAQPSATLAGLINGLTDSYELKAALKTDLSIA